MTAEEIKALARNEAEKALKAVVKNATHERSEKYKGGTIMLYKSGNRFTFSFVGHPKGDLSSFKSYDSADTALSEARRQIDSTF